MRVKSEILDPRIQENRKEVEWMMIEGSDKVAVH